MLTASGAFADTIDGQEMTVAAALSIDLPTIGNADYTLSLKSISFDTQDTSSFPDDLTDRSGYTDTGGSLVLGGASDPTDETATWVGLLNPDDPDSVLYRQKVKGSALTFDFGVVPAGQPKELLRRITGRVQSYVVDVAAGTVTVEFIDLSADWGQLPGMPAVVVDAPFNAGLTSEYALDRIARTASAGAVSSWPAQRTDCVLAIGMRSSPWPEVGTFDTASSEPDTSFAPGVFGTALAEISSSPGDWNTLRYRASAAISRDVFIEFWVKGIGSSGATQVLVGNSDLSEGVSLWIGHNELQVEDQTGGGIDNLSIVTGTGAHYVAAYIRLPAVGSKNYSGTYWFDSTATTFSFNGISNRNHASWEGSVAISSDTGTVEAVQVTTEPATPTPNDTFTPQAILDPSLNPLQAAPSIEVGTDAWDEIQTIAQAEGGYACRDNQGRFIFLNRDSILNQASQRSIKLGTSLKTGIQTSVGAVSEYGDIAIDYTEYSYGDATAVFSPVAKWKVPARTTQTWVRSLPNDTIAAITPGTFALLPDGTDPTDGTHWYRASRDKFGNTAHGDLIGTVDVLTSSTVRITFTNSNGNDAWLVSPASYLDVAAGTVSVWVGGIPIHADDPTTVHVSNVPATPTYTAETNTYRQDRDATIAWGKVLLSELHAAKPTYQNLSIVPDARLVVPDRVTLDLPLANGAVEPADVLIWGLSFTADFGQGEWDMTLDVRRCFPPGAWIGGVAGSSEGGLTTWGT